jgi:hypothetical protein
MRLSWEQIALRAREFSAEWANETYERGEAQSFYNDFFAIFGVKRRQIATYERRVQSHDRLKGGFIDLFWPGTLIAEHKSGGGNLLAATGQALNYFDWLPTAEQPRYILTCDFQNWRLLDLDENREIRFALKDLHKHVTAFAFILGRRRSYGAETAVTIAAAELMGRLHDALKQARYTGHDLELLLVRLLFCLFADDTGIFEPKDIFLELIENDTREDGSDTGDKLIKLFDILDTPEDQRQTSLSDEWKAFPYVNGALFRGAIRVPAFSRQMRTMLLEAARFNWSGVSPAIFGSLFQSVMNPEERRKKGAHYTTEANILKVIGPLFLDDLRHELETLKARKTGRAAGLNSFCQKLPTLRFLDPACGCGNFLVIAYRELRKLELEALEALYPKEITTTGEAARQGFTDIGLLARVSVDQFYGIEYEEFPARIAEVAMWMTDHLANNELSIAFGQSYARIPLKQSAHIRHADALELDWNDLIPAAKCSYVMGNPPFIGAKYQSETQRAQVRRIARLGGSGGTLDYVAAWFLKAADYMSGNRRPGLDPGPLSDNAPPSDAAPNPRLRIAFVSTNSITQGEQVAQLWPTLFHRHKLDILFAHRTFAWGSEARGVAHVHVVIVGLEHRDVGTRQKRLFSYPDIKGEPVETRHDWLTAYLFPAREANRHLVVKEESRPINGARQLISGTQPIDDGNYIFNAAERATFLELEPGALPYLRPFIGAIEYISGAERWILCLQDVPPAELSRLPHVLERMERVRTFRRLSERSSTKQIADKPTAFNVTVMPVRPFLCLPEVSSERREYIPIGWLEPPTIPSNKVRLLIDATLFEFAVLTSAMHVAWCRQIGGRLKSDFQYGIGLNYNTFPWPDDVSVSKRAQIETLAQAVLDARAAPQNAAASLAQLYDPLTMPAALRKAHADLDRAVDRLYRPQPFASDIERVEHLFTRYENMVSSLSAAPALNRKQARKSATRSPAEPV